jgi:hypothetical protein
MDLLVVCAVVGVAWMAVALVVAALCRAAARVDADVDNPATDVLLAHDRRRRGDNWRAAVL